MSAFANNSKIIKTWIEKGDLEKDNFSRFICYWVAFNCWLYTVTNEVIDSSALSILYKKRHLYNNFSGLVLKHSSIFNALTTITPIKNNRIKERKEKDISDVKNFNEVMDVLYEARCNLFHGSKIDTDERDKEVMEAATPVIKIIAKEICLTHLP